MPEGEINPFDEPSSATPAPSPSTPRRDALTALGLDVLVLGAALAVLLLGLGDYGLYEPHEGHFAGVAREMLLREDWVTPYLNGAPYLNKPPLLYWAIAASYKLFGISEWAARFPLAIAGWFGAIVVWQWGRELARPATGRVAALMLATACGWFVFTHQLLIDVMLSSLLVAAYYCLWRAIAAPPSPVYRAGFWVFLGLCVLAKGPSMLVFPAIAVAGMAFLDAPDRVWRAIDPWLGVPLLLLLVLPWAVAAERANPGFLRYFLLNENLQRIADRRYPPDYDVSKIGALGYLAITVVWGLPWSLALPPALAKLWQETQRDVPRPPNPDRPDDGLTRSQTLGLSLLAIAAALPVLVFLPLSSRLIYYSLPSLPPLMLLCAVWWTDAYPDRGSRRRGRQLVGGLLTLLGAMGLLAIAELPNLLTPLAPRLVPVAMPLLLCWSLGCGIGGLFLWRQRPVRSWLAIALGSTVTYFIVTQGFSVFADLRSSRTLMQQAQPRVQQTAIWVFEGSRELGAAGALSFYRNPRGILFSAEADLPPGWVRARPDSAYPIVYVLKNGGENRILPAFPGKPPEYAIDAEQLQAWWRGDRPVVFVTDFLRQPGDPSDPMTRNLPEDAGDPLLIVGSRHLYGNRAARATF